MLDYNMSTFDKDDLSDQYHQQLEEEESNHERLYPYQESQDYFDNHSESIQKQHPPQAM